MDHPRSIHWEQSQWMRRRDFFAAIPLWVRGEHVCSEGRRRYLKSTLTTNLTEQLDSNFGKTCSDYDLERIAKYLRGTGVDINLFRKGSRRTPLSAEVLKGIPFVEFIPSVYEGSPPTNWNDEELNYKEDHSIEPELLRLLRAEQKPTR